MKKLLLIFSVLGIAISAFAQDEATLKLPIPHYHILKSDSTYSTWADLKHKPVMIIYFSPDCSHCQHLIHELQPKIKQLGDIQIVLISWVQYKMIKNFYHDYDLAKYPNVTVGTEGYDLMVMKYFQIKTTPFIAIYNRNGKMVQYFDKVPKVEDITAAVKKV